MDEPLFKQINSLRKSGQLEKAWDIGHPAIEENPNDQYLKGAFFWVCYDYLKNILSHIIERGKSTDNYIPQQHETERIRAYLEWVIWLDIPPGGFEYTQLLIIFRKNAEHFPEILNLVLTHQLSIFNEDSRKPYKTDKGEVPSLLLTYARKLAKYWLDNRQQNNIDLEAVLSFMDVARETCQDTQHKIWLDYDQAKCFVLTKQYNKARKLVVPVLKKKQRESWAWGALAATYKEDNQDAAICLYSQAINYAYDDSFALPALESLAVLLSSRGMNEEASMCLKRAINCYENKGWKIKNNFQNLISQSWYNENADVTQLSRFLKETATNANQYLHGETKNKVGMVIALHQSGKGCNVYYGPNNISTVPFFVIKGDKPKEGEFLKLTVPADNENGDIISAVISESVQLEGTGTVQGDLRVTDEGFGFVDNVFIPQYLINEVFDNKLVEVFYYLDLDKKKGKLGKKAATVTVASNAKN